MSCVTIYCIPCRMLAVQCTCPRRSLRSAKRWAATHASTFTLCRSVPPLPTHQNPPDLRVPPGVLTVAPSCPPLLPLFGVRDSSARHGGVCIANCDLRPGQGISWSVRSGVPATCRGRNHFCFDVHNSVHAVRHCEDTRSTGKAATGFGVAAR